MVKIISRKSLGNKPVYDIGVAKDHNFLLGNGLVASNCFNKSHSMAYGFVTYQTAYLKANYPVEYMAALLSANSGDTDKVQKYIESCQKSLGIEVVPPDINRSELDFTPVKNQIIFGLSAIKNVGEGAIEHLLSVRREGGEFKSLANLCDRINLQTVNSRALESLIKCGALDQFISNRQQAIEHLKKLIPWAQGRLKDREVGQQSIFDLLGGGTSSTTKTYEGAPKPDPKIADFSLQEKLQFEKELLGFYVSEHPLTSVQKSVVVEDAVTLAEVTSKKSKVKVLVMLTAIKLHTTKKGERMAFLQVEDLTGQMEAIVFALTFKKIDPFPMANDIVVIVGKVEKKEDKTQLIVDEIQSINVLPVVEKVLAPKREDLPSEVSDSMILLRLQLPDVEDKSKLQQLQALLTERSCDDQQQAQIPVGAFVISSSVKNPEQFVYFGRRFWVENAEETINALTSAGFEGEISSPIDQQNGVSV